MGTQLCFVVKMSACVVEYDAETCDFPIENLPYGVFSTEGTEPRVGVAIGDQILDLAAVAAAGLFSGDALSGQDVFNKAVLNDFMALGRDAWTEARGTITTLLSSGDSGIDVGTMLVAQADAVMHLPMKVGEFTDAYCSYHHAFKVGSMIRGPEEALKPNWLRMPIMYHGRSSTVQLSPNDVVRPWGQQKTPTSGEGTEFRPERLMDFELEMGIVIGQGNDQGKPITVKNASDHLFGLVLLNDWSARGIQIFEYAPLGPCRGKNLSTTIAPWVVTFDALEPFKIPAMEQDPAPHGYLVDPDHSTYDIKLEVALTTADHAEETSSEPEPSRAPPARKPGACSRSRSAEPTRSPSPLAKSASSSQTATPSSSAAFARARATASGLAKPATRSSLPSQPSTGSKVSAAQRSAAKRSAAQRSEAKRSAA